MKITPVSQHRKLRFSWFNEKIFISFFKSSAENVLSSWKEMSADGSILGLGWQNFKNKGCFKNFRVPQFHRIIQISQIHYWFCHNLWSKFSGKISVLSKKNKPTQFSQLFYFYMHFSFLPWWYTLKMKDLVRFCKKTFPGFPT